MKLHWKRFFSHMWNLYSCLYALIQYRIISERERDYQTVMPIFHTFLLYCNDNHSQALGVWDNSHTKPNLFPLHPFQVCQHIQSAPQPCFSMSNPVSKNDVSTQLNCSHKYVFFVWGELIRYSESARVQKQQINVCSDFIVIIWWYTNCRLCNSPVYYHSNSHR